jgi:OPT family oligopeptide transporter
MASPSDASHSRSTPPTSPTGPVGGAGEIPALSEDATPEQKDAHWFRHVYQGDKMPQLTIRAVLTGGLLGMLLAASNLYTTLNIGWAFGVAITSSVISFVIWSIITPIVRCRKMTILETNCMASTASAAGYSTGSTIATMFGALVLLQLVHPTPHRQDLAFESKPTQGTYRLTYLPPENKAISETGSTPGPGAAEPTETGLIPFDASVEDVARSLEGLRGIDPGDVTVAERPAGGWRVTFASNKDTVLALGIKDDTTQTQDGDTATASRLTTQFYTWDIHPVWLVAAFTLCTGLMGVFLAIPMKRQMINHEQLPFPSGIAAAETLRSLYSQSREAVRKAYVLILGLGIGALVAVLRTGQGTFNFLDAFYKTTKLEIPAHIPHDGFRTINGKQIYGFSVDTSVLLIAAGMIVGLRVSLSMLAGSLMLYLWLGPTLVARDVANAGVAGYIPSIEAIGGGTLYHFPRWGLWGGTALMVMASLMALALQWKTIVRAFMVKKDGSSGVEQATSDAMARVEVPGMWMVIGMVPITIAMVIIQIVAFSISWWAGLIAVAMSFVLSLVASRATGETDTTPIGAMGKVMQLLFALFHPGQIVPNLASAGIAANSASSSADLLTDLKSGYLLGANPRRQFLAQFFGVFFGTVAIVPIWYLMVPTKAVLEKLPAPATQTWAKVAEVLTKGLAFLPESAKIAILVGAGVGLLLPVVERFLVPKDYRKFMPSATGLGLAFMLPFYNSLAFTIGAVLAFIWGKVDRRSDETYRVPLASGLVAGESLIAALIAMLATAAGLLGWKL